MNSQVSSQTGLMCWCHSVMGVHVSGNDNDYTLGLMRYGINKLINMVSYEFASSGVCGA